MWTFYGILSPRWGHLADSKSVKYIGSPLVLPPLGQLVPLWDALAPFWDGFNDLDIAYIYISSLP